jgi:hypothetical protein
MHQEKTVKIQKGKLILNSGRCVSCNYVHDCTNPLIEQVCELSEQALKKKKCTGTDTRKSSSALSDNVIEHGIGGVWCEILCCSQCWCL